MCIENHFFIGPRIIFAVSRIYFLAYNALRALQLKGNKNTHFLQTSSPGGWRFSTSRYIKYGERSVLNETWCSSTEKYFSKRFASVFYLFSHIQLRIIAIGKTVNTWNMSGMLFMSNHASEIHSPNHRVLHVTVFCTARTVSALDFPGNRFTLS